MTTPLRGGTRPLLALAVSLCLALAVTSASANAPQYVGQFGGDGDSENSFGAWATFTIVDHTTPAPVSGVVTTVDIQLGSGSVTTMTFFFADASDVIQAVVPGTFQGVPGPNTFTLPTPAAIQAGWYIGVSFQNITGTSRIRRVLGCGSYNLYGHSASVFVPAPGASPATGASLAASSSPPSCALLRGEIVSDPLGLIDAAQTAADSLTLVVNTSRTRSSLDQLRDQLAIAERYAAGRYPSLACRPLGAAENALAVLVREGGIDQAEAGAVGAIIDEAQSALGCA